MKPFIALTGAGLMLRILNIMRLIISQLIISHQPDINLTGWAWLCILDWLLESYLFLVVWSFKAEVEEGEEAGGNYQGEVHSKREEREMLEAKI